MHPRGARQDTVMTCKHKAFDKATYCTGHTTFFKSLFQKIISRRKYMKTCNMLRHFLAKDIFTAAVRRLPAAGCYDPPSCCLPGRDARARAPQHYQQYIARALSDAMRRDAHRLT